MNRKGDSCSFAASSTFLNFSVCLQDVLSGKKVKRALPDVSDNGDGVLAVPRSVVSGALSTSTRVGLTGTFWKRFYGWIPAKLVRLKHFHM